MKLLFTILIFSCINQLMAQQDGGNFYLHFWHPNLYNPSAQLSDSLILVNSFSSWEKPKKTGYLNIAGGAAVPLKKLRATIGINYLGFNDYDFENKEIGLFVNKKFRIKNHIFLGIGTEIGLQSQRYFIFDPLSTSPFFFLERNYYNKKSLLLKCGITLFWKKLFFGVSCKNCLKPGLTFYRIYKLQESFQLNLFGGYIFSINKNLDINISALARQVEFNYIFDGSVSTIFQNKYNFGFSMRNNYPVDAAFQFGYKWQYFWLLGVFQPKNRYDSAAFEIGTQLQIPKRR